MKDVEKKNIIFLSDENTPYVKEFTLLSDSEIADLVERRLFSNNYFSKYYISCDDAMRICVGGYREGVCIDGWHMNLNTQKKINEIVADYQKCKSKAPTIQNMLRTL